MARRFTQLLTRRLKKHRTALLALAVYNFVFFFPIAFLGRVVSPNDVFTNFSPWNQGRPLDMTSAQNSLLNDPPTAYFTLLALAKAEPRAFHWNPYIASGVPGFGSSASAVVTPFTLLPLLVPLTWIYTAMAFLKLNAAFLFAYWWLREERLGKGGAAVGAIVIAGAGMYTVRWLWQITHVTALYPALLWVVRRALSGRRVPIVAVAFIAWAYATSGFPPGIAYGAWLVAAYAVYVGAPAAGRLVRRRLGGAPAGGRRTSRQAAGAPIGAALVGVLIGALIALPALIPFVQLIRRTGYLEARQATSIAGVYPLTHWRGFIEPDRLGNPALKNWSGDPALGVLNNYVESSIYLGLLTIPLVLLGLFRRRARARWFWLVTAALLLACMFGAPGIARFVSELPGFKYSALARVSLLLPLAIGYLVAAARLRWRFVYDIAAVAIAFDLALFAGRFYPYLTPEQAEVETTPTIAFLQKEPRPFRIAPMMDYLWPNTSELVRLEDVRSHFSSEGAYRRLLTRIDPTAWSGRSTVITFFSPRYDFNDPLNALLGIRWFIEHKYIDIMKWGIFQATEPAVKEIGTIPLRHGMVLQRTIRIDQEPFWSIELPINIEGSRGRIEVTLLKNGAAMWSRAFTADEAKVMSKMYVPLRPYARLGETVAVRVRALGVKGWMVRGENANAGEAPLFYARVKSPLIFEREFHEGRLFRNLAELPRFRVVSKLRKLNDEEFLKARDVDFEREAVITEDAFLPPALPPSNARVTLTRYAPDEQRLIAESEAPFFLASSEKLTPELGVTIDGRAARAVEVDLLFAGLEVPAGRHEIVFTRRLARGWWWAAWVGLALLAIAGVWERRRPGGWSGGVAPPPPGAQA